jgi:N-methylhydantoinase B/oxoprolinase/acetone carboxylase alpha subunit
MYNGGRYILIIKQQKPMPKLIMNDIRATIATDVDTRNKLKVVASFEKMTMQEWIKWVTDQAYQSLMIAKRRK